MKDIEEVRSWYAQNKAIFESLSNKVADIVEENVKEKKVQYHSVSPRGKSLESFIDKAEGEEYTDPVNEIKDMAGVRVITYLENDVSKVENIIEELFDIDWSNSVDQSQLLGSDKLGYRSVHYVAKFGKDRCKLPENERYKDLPFEIQVRSLLQHAWAEFAHDRNYKLGGKLPDELERRLYLAAGMLEIADHEFVAIDSEIDKYKDGVIQDLRRGDLDIEVTTASLTEYLSNKFSRLANDIPEEARYGVDNASAKTIVEELELFGISRLEQLDKIIPEDLEDNYMTIMPDTNFTGIIRDVLMISDIEKYFSVSWRESWGVAGEDTAKILGMYGVDRGYLEKHDIFFNE